MDRYGPGGAHEDERVVAMMNGRTPQGGGKEGSVSFLHFLKQVDAERKALGAEGTNGDEGVGPGGIGDSLAGEGKGLDMKEHDFKVHSGLGGGGGVGATEDDDEKMEEMG